MEVCTIGGFEEVGKNMTAVKVGEDVVIFDCGIYLPPVVELQEKDNQILYTEKKLRDIKAIPDDLVLDKLDWRHNVRAIVISHAHLDHVGAVPYLAQRYPNAEIIGTPFTISVLQSILRDEKIRISNKIRKYLPNSIIPIQGKEQLKVELLHTTHSTIQSSLPVLHTKQGIFFYALDFKFDNYPIIGNPPNYTRLRELSRKGVKVLVVDSLYSGTDRRTPSERIARNLVEDAMGSIHDRSSAMFITTFSSHIARLKTIVDFGKRTHRQIVFIGRSLSRYTSCAIEVNQCPFQKTVRILKYRKQVNSFLKQVEQSRGKYLVVCTGHQAEPGSILSRIVNNETPFKFRKGDNLIFSSSIIPTEVNIRARAAMDKKLRIMGVRIQTDVHVSGHGGREDLRDLVQILKPQNIIPAHGSQEQEKPMIEMSKEFGYEQGKTVFLSTNGKVWKFN